MKSLNIPHPHLSHLANRHQSSPCPISGQDTKHADRIYAHALNPHILTLIHEKHPDLAEAEWYSREAVNKFQREYFQSLIQQDEHELSELDHEVLESIHEDQLLTTNCNDQHDNKTSLGERAADRVANFGGSWSFVIGFTFFILIWMSINTYWFFHPEIFDPYPFILLNLALSCIAALQAPIIMMSQNRQNAKDRIRAENEYKVSLKAELEIRNLTSKLDQLMHKQWSHLLEMQQMQLETLNQLNEKKKK